MRSRWIAWLVVVGVSRAALAQAPGQIESPSPAFLEKRVPEELAAEGVMLSRHNLALRVEQVGDRWLVSLADLATGRVVASTKVDALPVDREAAVASMTHVVADLVAQVVGRAETPPPPPPPPPPVAPPAQQTLPPPRVDDRAEREVAELRFKRQSIRFGTHYQLFSTGQSVGLVRRWIAYQGELDQELEPEAFYAEIGRPDLAESYRARRHLMIGGFVVSALAVTAGFAVMLSVGPDHCEIGSASFVTCFQNHENDFHDALIEGAVIAGAGIVVWGVGLYLWAHPHPIDENEAKGLADEYNQNLRRQLGMRTATRDRPWLRDITWTPYGTGHQAGLTFNARF
jgi:hypothetical protein